MTVDFAFDAVVAGAGVVGIAVARQLALAGLHTALLEAADGYGGGISARSSEVLHAGLYYAPDSLKARLCAPGNRAWAAYCAARGVPWQRPGKLIVAHDEGEVAALERYRRRAADNGAGELALLGKAALGRRAPALRAHAALFSPDTGIIDSHAAMTALLEDFRAAGGVYARATPLVAVDGDGERFELALGGREPCTIGTGRLVNAAGLGAQALALRIAALPATSVPPLFFAAGHYFSLRGRAPCSHLVYPLAQQGALGVHLTLDLAGQARFGPDIAWRDSEDYRVDETRAAGFYAAIRRYWPGLPDGALQPDYVGIRPKLWGPSQPDQDFLAQGPREHGVAGLVNLFGIESPGLTAALPLAVHVLGMLDVA